MSVHRAAVSAVLVISALGFGGCGEDGSIQGPPRDAPSADLEILQTSSATNIDEGQNVTFTVVVRNNGPIEATSVFAGDSLSTGLTYQSHTVSVGQYSSATKIWEIGSLPVDGEATLTITGQADAGTLGDLLRNAAGVLSTSLNDSVPGNNASVRTVFVGEAAAGIVFASDWSSSTGNSVPVITDGGLWNNTYGQNPGAVLSVVAGSSLGWSKTPNVLRIGQNGIVSGVLERTDALPISTTHWGRFYFRNDLTSERHNHPVSYHPVGNIQFVPWQRFGFSDGVSIMFATGREYPFSRFAAGGNGNHHRLSHATWFRYEWELEYITTDRVRLWPRIYNMAGELMYDASTFFQSDAPSSGTKTLAQWYSEGNFMELSDLELARDFGMGQEGSGGAGVSSEYFYFADLALSVSTWIGQ